MTRTTLQQARSRATRKAIMQAAEQLWSVKNFDEISVDEVCQKAGMAKGTFYFYFPRKEHLLVLLVRARINPPDDELHDLLESDCNTVEVCKTLATIIATRARQLPKHLLQRGIEESFKHYRQISKLHGGERALRWSFDPVFARGQARGDISRTWKKDTLATSMGWALLQGLLFWSTGVISDDDIVDNLCERAELLANGATTVRRKQRVSTARVARRRA
jgi:AcrR family transcriptional regulator